MPIIKPKKNTKPDVMGSRSWEDMIMFVLTNPGKFYEIYHQRSIIEAVFGALKKMYGSHLNCRHPQSKRNKLAARIIAYNIVVVARAKVKEGSLTRQMLKAIA